MTEKTSFSASPRTLTGKKVKQLRAQGQVPANIFGNHKESVAITVERNPFNKLFDKVGESGLIYLEVSGKNHPVLVDTVEYQPITGDILHVSFREVNLKEKVSAEVPLEFIGEVDIPGAVVVTVRDSVEVEALPADLPESIQVDLSTLTEIGQSIVLADLKIDTTKLALDIDEEQLQSPIVLIQEKVEEPEEEPETEADAEAEGEATNGEAAPTQESAESAE